MSVPTGVLIMTAPTVPPNTIRSAVSLSYVLNPPVFEYQTSENAGHGKN